MHPNIVITNKEIHSIIVGVFDLFPPDSLISSLIVDEKTFKMDLLEKKIREFQEKVSDIFDYSLIFVLNSLNEVYDVSKKIYSNMVEKKQSMPAPANVLIIIKELEGQDGKVAFFEQNRFHEIDSFFSSSVVSVFYLNEYLKNKRKLSLTDFERKINEFLTIILFSDFLENEKYLNSFRKKILTANFNIFGVNFLVYGDFIKLKMEEIMLKKLLENKLSLFSNNLKENEENLKQEIIKNVFETVPEEVKNILDNNIPFNYSIKTSFLNSIKKNNLLLKSFCENIEKRLADFISDRRIKLKETRKNKELNIMKKSEEKKFLQSLKKHFYSFYNLIDAKEFFERFFISEKSIVNNLINKKYLQQRWVNFKQPNIPDCEQFKIRHPKLKVLFWLVGIIFCFFYFENDINQLILYLENKNISNNFHFLWRLLEIFTLLMLIIYLLISFYLLKKTTKKLETLYEKLLKNINSFFKQNYFKYHSFLEISVLEKIKIWGIKQYLKINKKIEELKLRKEEVKNKLKEIQNLDEKLKFNFEDKINEELNNFFNKKQLNVFEIIEKDIFTFLSGIKTPHAIFEDVVRKEQLKLEEVLDTLFSRNEFNKLESNMMSGIFEIKNITYWIGIEKTLGKVNIASKVNKSVQIVRHNIPKFYFSICFAELSLGEKNV